MIHGGIVRLGLEISSTHPFVVGLQLGVIFGGSATNRYVRFGLSQIRGVISVVRGRRFPVTPVCLSVFEKRSGISRR